MPGPDYKSKTGDAQIKHQGHTTNRSNGSNPSVKARSRGDATKLSAKKG